MQLETQQESKVVAGAAASGAAAAVPSAAAATSSFSAPFGFSKLVAASERGRFLATCDHTEAAKRIPLTARIAIKHIWLEICNHARSLEGLAGSLTGAAGHRC